MPKINLKTTIKKILEKGAGETLVRNGVPCMSCPYAPLEIDKLTIGEVCRTYGLDATKILKDLNRKKTK